MKTVTVIGSGMMGSALVFPARENNNKVRLVGTHLDEDIITQCKKTNRHPKFKRDFPSGVEFYYISDVAAALEGADLVICGVSSFGVEWFRDVILPILPDGLPVLAVTKGLIATDEGELITYVHHWQSRVRELSKHNPICAIGGPCTSYELVAHDQTRVTFCGEDMELLRKIKGIMATDYYHISLSTDIVGTESAVALKNGYALGVALTVGLNQKQFGLDSELHYNSQAAVFGQAVCEMQRLLEAQGAGSLDNLALGIGDLYVTVYGGRTRLVGILLGRGLSLEQALSELSGVTLESLVVSKRVARAMRIRAQKGLVDLTDYPLLMHIDAIVSSGAPADIPWDSFVKEY